MKLDNKKHKKIIEFYIILFIFIIALIFRIITALSQGWLADEIPFLEKGEWFSNHFWEYIFQVRHDIYPPNGRYFVNPPFSMWLMSIGIYIAEKLNIELLLGARFINVIFGSLTCVLIYLFGKKFYNKKVGIFAGLVLALSPTYIAVNSSAYLETISSFFVLLGLYLFFSFIDNRNKKYLYLLAIILGISIITKFLVIPIAGLVIIYLFYLSFNDKKDKNNNVDNNENNGLRTFIIFLIIFGVTPLILWAGARDIDSILGIVNYVKSMMMGNYSGMFEEYSGLTVGSTSQGLYFFLMIFGATLPIIGLLFPIATIGYLFKGLNFIIQKKNIDPFLFKQLFLVIIIITSVIFVNYFGLVKTTMHKIIFIFPIVIILTVGWFIQNIDLLLERLYIKNREIPILSIILLVSVLPAFMWSPKFYYAYNNFLVGGVQGASNLYRVGDGEGLEIAGKWLDDNTNKNEKITIFRFGTLLKKYTNRSIIGQPLNEDIDYSLYEGSSYLVVHNSHVSGQLQPKINFSELRTEFIVYVDNYPYVRIYNLKEYPYNKTSISIDTDNASDWNIYSNDAKNKIFLLTNSPKLKFGYKINKGNVSIYKNINDSPIGDGINIEIFGDNRKSKLELDLCDNKNSCIYTTVNINWNGWRRFYFSFDKMNKNNKITNISDIDTLRIIISSDKNIEGNIYLRNISIVKKN